MWIDNDENEDTVINLNKVASIFASDQKGDGKRITFECAAGGDDAYTFWTFETKEARDKCYWNIRGMLDTQTV